MSAPPSTTANAGADGGARNLARSYQNPALLLFAAAQAVDLSPKQRAQLAELERAVRPSQDAPARVNAHLRALRSAVVEALATGKLAGMDFTPHYKALNEAALAHQQKQSEALSGLHALLDDSQRRTLVRLARAELSERDVSAHARAGAKQDERLAAFRKRKLEHLSQDLGLDAAQRKSMEQLLNAPNDPATVVERERLATDKLLEAFAKPAFDVHKLDPGSLPMKPGLEQQVQLLLGMSAILKPAQRQELARELKTERGWQFFVENEEADEPDHAHAKKPR